MKALCQILFLFVVLITTACSDYSSQVPITNSKQSSIDSSFIGKWQYVPNDKNEIKIEKYSEHQLDIFPFNQNEYVIRMYNDQNDQIFSRAFISDVESSRYVNLQLLNFNAPDYYIYQFTLHQDTIYYYPIVKEKFNLQFKKSKNLKKALLNNNANGEVLGTPRKYVLIERNKIL